MRASESTKSGMGKVACGGRWGSERAVRRSEGVPREAPGLCAIADDVPGCQSWQLWLAGRGRSCLRWRSPVRAGSCVHIPRRDRPSALAALNRPMGSHIRLQLFFALHAGLLCGTPGHPAPAANAKVWHPGAKSGRRTSAQTGGCDRRARGRDADRRARSRKHLCPQSQPARVLPIATPRRCPRLSSTPTSLRDADRDDFVRLVIQIH